LRDLLSSIRSSLVDRFTVVSLHLSLSTLQFSAYEDQLFRTALLPHLTDPFSPIPQILRTLLLRRIQSRAYHLLIQIVLLFSNILSIIYHLYSSFQPRRLPIPIRVVVAPLCAPLLSSTSRIDFPLDTLHLLSRHYTHATCTSLANHPLRL
jgi:hypothetical protein